MKTLSEDRRALHRIPETGCRLPETASYLRGALAEMPCTLLAPWEDAVCAYFDLGKDETVAVRSDMDALPVTERTGLPFASAHPGRMHACGHDGHMAMVLGLARRLAAGEVRPQRNVLLIFEPAEETTCITEDFSEYQRHAPGVFFFLGTGGIELHAPTFTFPEEILDRGEALLCWLV